MNIKKLLGIVIGVALVGWILYSNIQQQKIVDNGKKTVYAILPLTGEYSVQGKEEQRTISAYTDMESNLAFNIKVLDNESNPTKSLSIAQQVLMSDKNPIFICAISSLCRPVIPFLNKNSGFLILISPQEEHREDTKFQRISMNHKEMNETFPNDIAPNETVSIIHVDSEACTIASNMIIKSLKEKGIKSLQVLSFMPSELDTRILALKALKTKPTSIIVIGAPTPGFLNVLKTLKIEQNYQGKIYVDPALRTPSVIAQFGNKMDGVYTSVMPIKRAQSEYPNVVQALLKNNIELYHFSINMWDIMDIVSYFVKNNIPFTQDEFMKLGKWHGISSDIQFLENGNSSFEFELAKVKDGKFIPVEQ